MSVKLPKSVIDICNTKKKSISLGVLLAVVAVSVGVMLISEPSAPLKKKVSNNEIRIKEDVSGYETIQAKYSSDIDELKKLVAELQKHNEGLDRQNDKLVKKLDSQSEHITRLSSENYQAQVRLDALRKENEAKAKEVSYPVEPSLTQPAIQQNKRVLHPGVWTSRPTQTKTTSSSKDKFVKNEFLSTIPANSFMTGVLLTGVDAGTGQAVFSDPRAVNIEITSDAILPVLDGKELRFKTKGCRILGSAFGSLSEERVFIRGTKMSCVSADGRKGYSEKVKMNINDSDSQLGLRGKLENRQGSKLGMAFLAGVAGSVSNSFSQAQGNISVNPLGSVQTMSGMDSMKSGLLGGLGGSANELSQFYIDMAKTIYPVIVVHAGRKITINLEDDAQIIWRSMDRPYVLQESVPTRKSELTPSGEVNNSAYIRAKNQSDAGYEDIKKTLHDSLNAMTSSEKIVSGGVS